MSGDPPVNMAIGTSLENINTHYPNCVLSTIVIGVNLHKLTPKHFTQHILFRMYTYYSARPLQPIDCLLRLCPATQSRCSSGYCIQFAYNRSGPIHAILNRTTCENVASFACGHVHTPTRTSIWASEIQPLCCVTSTGVCWEIAPIWERFISPCWIRSEVETSPKGILFEKINPSSINSELYMVYGNPLQIYWLLLLSLQIGFFLLPVFAVRLLKRPSR